MNIELDEVVVLDVSDDALEQAAGGTQGDPLLPNVTHVLNRFVECGSVSCC